MRRKPRKRMQMKRNLALVLVVVLTLVHSTSCRSYHHYRHPCCHSEMVGSRGCCRSDGRGILALIVDGMVMVVDVVMVVVRMMM